MNTKSRLLVPMFLFSVSVSIAVIYGDVYVPCARCDPQQTCSGSVLSPDCIIPGSVCTFDPNQTIQTLTSTTTWDTKKGSATVQCWGHCTMDSAICLHLYNSCSTSYNTKRSVPCD